MGKFNFKRFWHQWLKYKLDYVSLFVVMAIHYGRLQISQYFGDGDAFYHSKMALFLAQGRILQSMPWMQFSTLREHFTDHQLLYHLLLAPFTFINQNPLIGIKVATALFAVLMVVILYWLLKQNKVVWPWLMAASMASFEVMTFRLNLVKVNSLSLIVIWFLIYALFKRKIWLAALLGFIFVYLYAGWPLAIFICLIYFLADYIYHQIHTKKIHFFWNKVIHVFHAEKKVGQFWQFLIALGLGHLVAIIINPYFPQNLYFYYQQFVQIGIVNLGYKIAVGNEWYGISLLQLISYAPLLFIACFITFFLLAFNLKKVSHKTWFAFLLTFIFMFLSLKSRRYAEYYIPFGLLFSAFGISDLVRFTPWNKIVKLWNELHLALKIFLSAVTIAMLTLVMPGLYKDLFNPNISRRWTMHKYEKAAQWLKNNTPQNSLVFNNMWDDWGLLFYQNDHNYYIIGLDPTFMYNYDPLLSKKYFDIALYKDPNVSYGPDQVTSIIKNNFKSSYVIIEKSDPYRQMTNNIMSAKNSSLLYQDEEVYIFHISEIPRQK